MGIIKITIGLALLLILLIYAVAFINQERKREKEQKHALLRIMKHVVKTLLQAEYMKQNNIPIDWIVSYIKSKKNMPDKGMEIAIADMKEAYDTMFEEIISYIENRNLSSLLTIQRCVNRYADFDMLTIETGSRSEREFRSGYVGLPGQIKPGIIYNVYSKTDFDRDDLLQVVYIPRIVFSDYFP